MYLYRLNGNRQLQHKYGFYDQINQTDTSDEHDFYERFRLKKVVPRITMIVNMCPGVNSTCLQSS